MWLLIHTKPLSCVFHSSPQLDLWSQLLISVLHTMSVDVKLDLYDTMELSWGTATEIEDKRVEIEAASAPPTVVLQPKAVPKSRKNQVAPAPSHLVLNADREEVSSALPAVPKTSMAQLEMNEVILMSIFETLVDDFKYANPQRQCSAIAQLYSALKKRPHLCTDEGNTAVSIRRAVQSMLVFLERSFEKREVPARAHKPAVQGELECPIGARSKSQFFQIGRTSPTLMGRYRYRELQERTLGHVHCAALDRQVCTAICDSYINIAPNFTLFTILPATPNTPGTLRQDSISAVAAEPEVTFRAAQVTDFLADAVSKCWSKFKGAILQLLYDGLAPLDPHPDVLALLSPCLVGAPRKVTRRSM
jgi:hypothetical protein